MNKKLKLALIAVILLGAIVAVLLNNKARMAAETESFTLTAYPVSVIKVSRQNVTSDLSQVGVIAASRDVAVASETQGKVVAVYVTVGSYVQAGTVLAKVDDELQRSGMTAALTNYEKAKKDLERLESLHKQEIIADSQLESARLAFKAAEANYIASRRQYNNAAITSPIAGVVTSKTVEIGTMVSPGMPIANVVDISRLKVKLNLAEEDVFRIKTGDQAEITTDVYPGIKYYGRVETISAKGDDAHTYPVEIGLSNNVKNPLKAGMFGRVSFVSTVQSAALVIPRDALVGSVKNPQVYVMENDRAYLRKIVIGQEVSTNLTILSGLKEGETVIVSGQNNLTDNTRVSVIKQQ